MRCAIVIPPTGGPKDDKAPVVEKAYPKVGTTNFKGGTVLIEFNEEIEVDPNTNNIIVSPLIEGEIKIRERKKKYLEITIPTTLKENTTYSISLNNSIKDITEANVLKSVTYAFSTGPLLDSLTLSGKTVNIETKLPIKEALVGLYEKSDTVNIKKHKPLYLTFSDASGNFQFNYLKQGEYSLITLEDKNKNLLFDNQEKTDFIESISLTSDLKKPITLELSVSDTTGNKLLSKKPSPLKLQLTFRNGIKYFSYKNINTTNRLYIYQDKKKAKDVAIYCQNFEQDTLGFILFSTDSLGNDLADTLKIERQKKDTYKESISFVAASKDIISGSSTIAFVSTKPIIRFNSDSIFINDELATEQPFLSKSNDSLFLSLTPQELKDDTIKVDFKNGSVIFYDQDSLKKNSFLFTKADPSNYASLEMKIQTKEPNYIIQLLTEDYVILSEYKNITILKYDYINPGTYRIRAIVDKNNNGYWDRANPIIYKKAEPIYYYTNDKINLKPNWELKDLMFIF